MTKQLVLRAWNWLDNTIALDPSKLHIGTFVLLELFQRPVFRSADGNGQCAWPHTTNQHLLQLGVGRLDEGDYPTQLDKDALDMLKNSGKLIVGEGFSPADYFINFLQPWNDCRAVRLRLYIEASLRQFADWRIRCSARTMTSCKPSRRGMNLGVS